MCLSVVHSCFSVDSRSLTYNMEIIQSEVQAHASSMSMRKRNAESMQGWAARVQRRKVQSSNTCVLCVTCASVLFTAASVLLAGPWHTTWESFKVKCRHMQASGETNGEMDTCARASVVCRASLFCPAGRCSWSSCALQVEGSISIIISNGWVGVYWGRTHLWLKTSLRQCLFS